MGESVNRRAGETDVGGIGKRPHEEVPQIASGGAVGFINQYRHALASVDSCRYVVKLMNG